MGLYDRDYSRYNYRPSNSGGGFNMPQMTPAVQKLIIINVAVFLLDGITQGRFLTQSLALVNHPAVVWQLWRLIGYQFLHADIMHLLFNMLGLYFLGNTLEKFWGTKKFLTFYLGCGVAGGLCFFLFTSLKFLKISFLVGASGAVLGLLGACAILFPQFVVFIFVFPVPIRKAAVLFLIIYLLNIVSAGRNAGGDAAHLGGLIAGAAYVLWPNYKQYFGFSSRPAIDFTSYFKHTSQKDAVSNIEVDRILKKVHEQGLHSLTEAEKRTLRQATEQEQKKN